MTDPIELTRSAFKYLTGETENICRLCFGSTNGGVGVYLHERRLIQCSYYDDTVSYADMLTDLGAISDTALPQWICEHCADMAVSTFLFQQVCKQSRNKWDEFIEKFNKTLDLCDALEPTVKTACMVIHNARSIIVTSRKLHKERNKQVSIEKIQNLIKTRDAHKNIRIKKITVACDECGKVRCRRHLPRNRVIMHSERNYPCKQCDKTFTTKTKVHYHTDRVHKPKTVKCQKCSKMYGSMRILKLHDTAEHTEAICRRCFITFPSKSELRHHLNIHDINKCPRCDKVIKHKNTFKNHLKVCGNDDDRRIKFFCDICNKGYARKIPLKSHLVTQHGFGKVYYCDWCNKPYDSKCKLKMHIVKHTKEKNYHCHMCGGQFVSKPALTYHVRLHTGEKPFPCDLCDERFLSASRRMEHKRRKHLGPNRECPICQSKFMTGHELKKHVVRHKNPQSRLYIPGLTELKLKLINDTVNKKAK